MIVASLCITRKGCVFILAAMALVSINGYLRLPHFGFGSSLDIKGDKVERIANYDEDQENMKLRFCGLKQMVFPSATRNSESTVTIDVGYQCEGEAYDNFTALLKPYARQSSITRSANANNKLWGKRDYPFQDNTTILAFGNSHTRQVFYTLLCQYAEQVMSVESLGPSDIPYFSVFIEVVFYNNASALFLGNHPLVYSRKWPDLLQLYDPRNRTIDQFDAVVLGMFNNYRSDFKNHFVPVTLAFQERHPEMMMDLEHVMGPTLETLVPLYPKKIVALPMFNIGNHTRKWEASANHIRNELRMEEDHASSVSTTTLLPPSNRRTNICVLHTRQHIEALGAECGTQNSHFWNQTPDVCHTGEEGGSAMHRCTGARGGDADLIVWDLIEALHQNDYP